MAKIIEAARAEFLRAGYAGATIDEIARAAEMSRGSFYTYFPSKRDVLLAVGEDAAKGCVAIVEQLPALGMTRAGMETWMSSYFDFLDVHGGFAFAWVQAAAQDADVRRAGKRRHLGICRRFGTHLAATAGRTVEEPVLLGLTVSSAIEQSWNYAQLYEGTLDRHDVVAQTAQLVWAAPRQPRASASAARADV